MKRYAENTAVPAEKSKAEIERLVQRYGADGFISGWSGDKATVQFRLKDRHVRFVMTLPARDDKRFTRDGRSSFKQRSEEAAYKAWEQACRQKWRALALLVKAKLEAVDSQIVTLEEAFFAHVVMPGDGRTLYEIAREPIALAYERGASVPLLPGSGS
jgi:hypothetical protein